VVLGVYTQPVLNTSESGMKSVHASYTQGHTQVLTQDHSHGLLQDAGSISIPLGILDAAAAPEAASTVAP